MKGIIDRFEGEIVVIEIDNKTKNFPRSILPKEATVGDMVRFRNGKVSVLKEETENLRKEIDDLMNEVWED